MAVHPDDERYRHLVGRTAIVPIVDREVPIIADEYVKMDFGTGALKITPGHDPNDFEIGRRHGLAELAVIGFDGRMTAEAGEFAGLPAAEARQKVVDRLFARRAAGGRAALRARGRPLRPDRRPDRAADLAAVVHADGEAGGAGQRGRAHRHGALHPKRQENIYFHWMDNIRPWCISRQLWWGHQIPVWYCPDGHLTVDVDDPAACAECGSAELQRDPDVLDTWFSSALWPFATLGWPEHDRAAARLLPRQRARTAREIINLWVARMLMTGIEFMGEKPFTDVYIPSIIQAADGRRMSKSLGTGINPLDLIDRYGADATRYGLLKMSSTQDVRFAEGMLDEGCQARKQAVERRPLRRCSGRPRRGAGSGGVRGRGSLDPVAAGRHQRAGAARAVDAFEFAAAVKDAVRVRLERRLRLVRRVGQGAPLRRRRRGAA